MLAALPFGASAQASGPEAGQLTTINITAERRLENIQQVPVSASVLQPEILDVLNTSGQDIRMLSGRVPSLYIESSFGRAFPRCYIRGYGNTDFRLNASQPVSLVYDDVVQENPILKGFPAFDLESVEVLRGPQGSLFGRNTPAGVVKFNSVKPGKKAEDYGSLSFGTYSTVNLEGAATLPTSGPGVIPFSVETADGIPRHRQWTQELRLESVSSGPLNWQAGVYLFHEDYTVESFSYDSLSPGNPQNGYERVRQKNDAAALFAGLNYAFSPSLKLRGGVRYTRDKKKFDVEDYNNSGFAPCIGPTIGAEPGPIRCTYADLLAAEGPGGSLSASPSASKLSWDLGGTYSLGRATNLYARVATGFRGSSVQGASALNTKSIAAPETNLSYEAGVKTDLFNRRARLNFGLFRYDVSDLQLTAVGGSSNSNILLNAKKASGQGFELDLQAFVTDNLLATIGLSYNDTKIKDGNLVVSACGTLQNAGQPIANCTLLGPVSYEVIPENGNYAAKANINGNPLPQAPKITTNFTLKYTQPMGSGELYAFTDWVYRGKVNFFLYESTEFTGKALLEGGLRLGYTWDNGRYDVAGYVRNITNQIRDVGGIDFNNLTGFINEPRTYGLQAKMTF